jgi:hypothetical protein
MEKKLHQAFKKIKELDPPGKLSGIVLHSIRSEINKQTRKKLILSYVGLAASLVVGIYTTVTFGTAFLKSEFWSVILLSFSDAGVVMQNWGDFFSSLMETFPTFAVAAILTPIFTLLLSLGLYLDSSNRNYNKFI